MADRPADIISPITDQVLPLTTSTADALAAGRVPYDKPTPANSVMLFVHALFLDSAQRLPTKPPGPGG